MPDVLEYQTDDGQSLFGTWFWRLDARAAARVTRTVNKLEAGLRPDVKPVGEGVFEARIDHGPGYRVYFGLDGEVLVILLGGGNKQSQTNDITQAKVRWADYQARKRKGLYHGAHP